MSTDVVKLSKLPIAGVIAETWRKVKGMKLAYLGALLVSFLTLIVIILVLAVLPKFAPTPIPVAETVVSTSTASTSSPVLPVSATPAIGDKATDAAVNAPTVNTSSPTLVVSPVPGTGDNLQASDAPKKAMGRILEHPGILLLGFGLAFAIYYILFLLITCVARLGVYRAFDLPLSSKSYFAPYVKFTLVITVFLYYMFLYMSLIFPIFLPVFVAVFSFAYATPPLALAATVLMTLPALFVLVRLELGLPIILLKEGDVFTAMGESWQCTRHYFWRLLLLNVINVLLIIVPLIPLFLLKQFNSGVMIGLAIAGVVILFWTIPYVGISFGVIYKRLKA